MGWAACLGVLGSLIDKQKPTSACANQSGDSEAASIRAVVAAPKKNKVKTM